MADLDQLINNKIIEITQIESELKVVEQQLGHFKITDKTLEIMRSHGISDAMYDKLKTLKDKEFRGRRLFVDELNKMFAKEELEDRRNNILSASQIPNSQNPAIPEGEVTRAINSDSRIAAMKLVLEQLDGRLARAKANATDQSAPVVVDFEEQVQKQKEAIETKRNEIRNDIVAAVKSSSLLKLQEKVTILEEKIAVAKETRDRWKQDHDVLRQSRGSNAMSNIEVSQWTKEIDAERDSLDKVRKKKIDLLAANHMDNRARIRETAQALPNNNLNKKNLHVERPWPGDVLPRSPDRGFPGMADAKSGWSRSSRQRARHADHRHGAGLPQSRQSQERGGSRRRELEICPQRIDQLHANDAVAHGPKPVDAGGDGDQCHSRRRQNLHLQPTREQHGNRGNADADRRLRSPQPIDPQTVRSQPLVGRFGDTHSRCRPDRCHPANHHPESLGHHGGTVLEPGGCRPGSRSPARNSLQPIEGPVRFRDCG
jgi:hypothetical protein